MMLVPHHGAMIPIRHRWDRSRKGAAPGDAGAGHWSPHEVGGETPKLAARLHALAALNMPVIGESGEVSLSGVALEPPAPGRMVNYRERDIANSGITRARRKLF